MKPFTVETPVLRLRYAYNSYDYYRKYKQLIFLSEFAYRVIFGETLEASTINLKISSRNSLGSVELSVDFDGHGLRYKDIWSFYYFDPDFNRWLCENTPLGDLKPGESATNYVTLCVHED